MALDILLADAAIRQTPGHPDSDNKKGREKVGLAGKDPARNANDMIISASYRTDIPAFYRTWFQNRFAAGFCRVSNPYGGPPTRVSLRDDVDGYVFWTRNAAPFRPALDIVHRAGLPFIVQYTVTGYPRALESGVPDGETSVAVIRRLASDFGRRAVVWRYDPILYSDLTPPDWHRANFAGLACRLEGAVDEVVVSFAQIYRKTGRNLAAAAQTFAFGWQDPPGDEKRRMLSDLAAIAGEHGMRLALCTQPDLVSEETPAARCIDAARLSDLAGRPIAARIKGNRPGCLCAESRDIGTYDSCPQGCVYCYAVDLRSRAKDRLRRHDPDGEFLLPPAAVGK
ncbi:DUF1848 domain-containing protein [Telmatospirillum sp.]|uniref:DUF1848 domain-containing protein n=1 Tax=Telmatospirillum sp. TaxID=2079197 RepID=UPI002852850C|nr:DUF1848 domain-containing protein [Telmatospirillum sp.]